MVKALAVELAPERITVNCVVPGSSRRTPGHASSMTQEQWRVALARIPLGRLGRPADVAAATAFLASRGAAYVTGQSLHVNGEQS
jgi:NAD(P)-dependent dehydrogenase (short-subunit alcohol dehydrogenase family)